MVVLYDSNRGDWSEDLLSRLLENKKRYCLKHNYDFIVANDIIDRTRPVAWSKLMAVLRQLNTHDTVFYLDMDAIVMNTSVSLEALLDNQHIFPSHQYLLMTSDWNGVNTGAFLARNSSWTQAFLRAAWSQVIISCHNNMNLIFTHENFNIRLLRLSCCNLALLTAGNRIPSNLNSAQCICCCRRITGDVAGFQPFLLTPALLTWRRAGAG
jgi:hypothetical protein